jgi:sporadic carbohydrate cluster 2OG-Fe(II) oxygenase
MSNFLSKEDKILSKEFIEKGYIIRKISDYESLEFIQKKIVSYSEKNINQKNTKNNITWLNEIHNHLDIKNLNDFRLNIINSINHETNFREKYFNIAKKYLDVIVGNEVSMQLRVNLSIQLPGDTSSLLPVHADTWSGDSPYEVVAWVPLVNCFKTKTMFILNPEKNKVLNDDFRNLAGQNSDNLYKSIEKDVEFLNVKFGEILIFNQSLPHGNRVNNEKETRWSMNCRFKGIFTPYSDKKIGEFFEPVTLRAASKIGMNYKVPILK